MIDPNLLRRELDETARRLSARGFELDVKRLQALEQERKAVQVRTQELQNERNVRSKAIGKAKSSGENIEPLVKEVSRLGDALKESEGRLSQIQAALNAVEEKAERLAGHDGG